MLGVCWMVISRRMESPSFPSARRRSRRRGWEERGGHNSHRPHCAPNTIASIHDTALYYATRIITSFHNALITDNSASPPPPLLPPNHRPRPPKHPIPPPPPTRNLPLKWPYYRTMGLPLPLRPPLLAPPLSIKHPLQNRPPPIPNKHPQIFKASYRPKTPPRRLPRIRHSLQRRSNREHKAPRG